MTKIFNLKSVKERRRQLRKNMPEEEAIVWSKLKNRQLLGSRFLRQYSISSYIIDFYCPKIKLAIELDGSSHDGKDNKIFDTKRQKEIESMEITFMRFKNAEIKNGLSNVLRAIKKSIEELNLKQSIL